MRLERAAFQFGMILNADKPRMVGQLDGLGQDTVRGKPGKAQTLVLKTLAIADIHLVTVAMALLDFGGAVDFSDAASRSEV